MTDTPAPGQHPQTDSRSPEPLLVVNPLPVARSNVARESGAGVCQCRDLHNCSECYGRHWRECERLTAVAIGVDEERGLDRKRYDD